MFDSQKIGRFEIDAATINGSPEVVRAVMGTCIVIDVEHLWHKQALLYTALSDDFEEADSEAQEPPLYDINVAEDGTVTWAKQEA